MKTTRITIRIALNAAVGASILFLPWWFVIPVVLILMLYCRAYEVLLWGIAADLLYGVPQDIVLQSSIFYTLTFALLFGIVEYGKRFFIVYRMPL